MNGTDSPRPSQATVSRTVLRTRAGREVSVGHVPCGGPGDPGAGRVVLEVVQQLDERAGVLCAGFTPDEARRFAEALLSQAVAAEGTAPVDVA